MHEVRCGVRMKRQPFLAFIIRPPAGLISAITSCAAAVQGVVGEYFPALSPPHLTLLYVPCGLLSAQRIKRAAGFLRTTPPMALRYVGCRVSDHHTVQCNVYPQLELRQLHLALLAVLELESFTRGSTDTLLDRFNTTNIGEDFSAHVTLGRFMTRLQAETAVGYFATLAEMDQQVTQIWIADATGPLDYRLAIRLVGHHTNSMAMPPGV